MREEVCFGGAGGCGELQGGSLLVRRILQQGSVGELHGLADAMKQRQEVYLRKKDSRSRN